MGHYTEDACSILAEDAETAWNDFLALHDANEEDRRGLIAAEAKVAEIEAEILRLRNEAALARDQHVQATADRDWLVEDREGLVEQRDEIAPVVAAQQELAAAIELAEAKLAEWQAALEAAATCQEGLDGADELMPDRYGEMVAHCAELWEQEAALYSEWDLLDDDVTTKSEAVPAGDFGDPEDLAAELVTLQEAIAEDDRLIAELDAELAELSEVMTENEETALALETDDLLTAMDDVTNLKLRTEGSFANEQEAKRLSDDLNAEWQTNCAPKVQPPVDEEPAPPDAGNP